MKLKILLLLSIVSVTTPACIENLIEDSKLDTEVVDKPDTASTNDTLKSHLNISISTDKSSYSQGEIAQIAVLAENVSDKPAFAWLSSSCEPIIRVYIDTVHNGNKGLANLEDSPCNLGNIGQVTISPGKVISRDVIWDITIGENINAPNGKFDIMTEIALSDGFYNRIGEVVSSTSVVVTSSQNYISQNEALVTTYLQTIISDWYAANQYETKCIMPNDTVARFDPTGKVSYEVTTASTDGTNTIPGCSARLIAGPIWRISFFNKFGASPGDYQADIDAVSGILLNMNAN